MEQDPWVTLIACLTLLFWMGGLTAIKLKLEHEGCRNRVHGKSGQLIRELLLDLVWTVALGAVVTLFLTQRIELYQLCALLGVLALFWFFLGGVWYWKRRLPDQISASICVGGGVVASMMFIAATLL